MKPIGCADELEQLIGQPLDRVRRKVRSELSDFDRQWLAASPFCVISTADARGRVDASPKGDPAGFIEVLDNRTIAIPERPGNKLAFGFRNILENPNVGVLSIVPGRTDTLRINGQAQLVSDGDFFDRMVVKGHRPRVAIVVSVEEVFTHCGKAFMRSGLWEPGSWDSGGLPSMAMLSKAYVQPDTPLEDLESYYGPSYAERMYKD
ncbi:MULTISPECIES: pyridoxamine 5'-phosphate oxidase family protein [Paenarthrobacter]|uniref:pyridoxamine 5'-phosphate oxidase family protein n=1 Tax=Paenarthrobacter TaxID=1742992 RepID=UPI001877B094|nr:MULTISPECIES: pyridoxamine 5'-phosphate oxidase family protein [Paenarthrobacter]QOT15725.1 pyridoxamine 5'-phosphate oxidase family protein [Paenarthrobacter sp. YJN-5]UOD80746.1 pyridoxamine 5'-phosphate oxidase family protein [Paenarthrobacter ureafaciens]WNZ03405.1 pyridoxamine 5'-phosphate oxidase family protein [Paenarthrobacter ureafaciens]